MNINRSHTKFLTPPHQHLLSSEPWDLGQFKEQYLQSYLSRL